VSGSGSIYTVSVSTGTGSGTLRLDLADDDSIVDQAGKPLGGIGAGNGDFNTGEVYAIVRAATDVFIAGTNIGSYTIRSIPTSDRITQVWMPAH